MIFNQQRYAWGLLPSHLKRKIILVFLFSLIISAMEVLGISLILPVLALLIEPELIEKKKWLEDIYVFSGAETPRVFVQYLLILMAVVILLKNIASIFLNRWQIFFLRTASADVSKSFFEKYLHMPFQELAKRDTGFFAYVIGSLGDIFYSSMVLNTVLIVTEVITILLLVSLLLISDPVTTFLSIGILTVSGLLIYFFSARNLRELGNIIRKISASNNLLIKETFNAFKEIRVSGRGQYFIDQYSRNISTLSVNNARQMSTVMQTRHYIEMVVILVIVIAASYIFSEKNVGEAVGQLSLFGAVTLRTMPSITRVISSLQLLKTTEAAMDLYRDEQNQIRAWPETNDNYKPENRNADKGVLPIDLKVNVGSFSYQASEKNILGGIDIDIPFGTSLGLAGASGAGKTTLADLILGVMKPTEGSINYNGEDLHDDLAKWKSHIAYVPQNISFFSSSLRENIAFGIKPEDIDDEFVWTCLRQAQLEERVQALPDGIYTVLKENGSQFSGGERQRLGIARALYQKASVLVLDEATSALDVETENHLTEVIHNLRHSHTVIVIAHRLTTLKDCTQVAFMQDGQIQNIGNFNNLYSVDSRFRKMVDLSRIDVLDETNS